LTDIVATKAFRIGQRLKKYIHETIDGRMTMDPDDAGAIASCVAMCSGHHIEVGVLHGGSLILAALIKQIAGQTGKCYGVDPFGWFEGQTQAGPEPSPFIVLANAKKFGVEVHPHKCHHPPLPDELARLEFDTAFIDGDHSYAAARADWEYLKNRVRRYVLFHDIQKHDARHGADDVFREAAAESEWEIIYLKHKTGVLERVGS